MSAVAAQPLDVILRDGTTLRLRSPAPDDADALLEFFRGLSQESLYRRFHGFPELGIRLVEPLTARMPTRQAHSSAASETGLSP